jgi:hypothetical protein
MITNVKSDTESFSNIDSVLSSPIAITKFLEFLTGEYSQENLLAYLDLTQILDELTENSKSHKTAVKISEWLKKHIISNNLNLSGSRSTKIKNNLKNLKIITEETSESYKGIIKELLLDLKMNLLDGFIRFKYTKEFKELLQTEKEIKEKTSFEKTFNDRIEYILNDFMDWPVELPKSEPNFVVKDLLQSFLDLINKNDFLWEINEKAFQINFDSLIEVSNFNSAKQKSCQLGKNKFQIKPIKEILNLKKLTNSEKLSLYINVYNTLMIHSCLVAKGQKRKNKKEILEYEEKVKYKLAGKVLSLKDLKKKIYKLFENKFPKSPNLILFVLCDV